MRDKDTIINQIVSDAARIMEMKVEFNESVINQMKHDPERRETAAELYETNKRIKEAIDLMREHGGCWA